MKIGDIMTKSVSKILEETTVEEAAQIMKAEDIGSLPVTDGAKIRGMLTDRDIITRVVALGLDPAATPAKEAMTRRIKYVFEDEDIREAGELMKDKQIRRLVVLNRDKRLVGVLSFGDLARLSSDEHLSADVARCVSEREEVHASH